MHFYFIQLATAMKMELSMSLLLLSLTWWIELSNSLCSLQINPNVGNVRITIDCGDQCRPSSSYLYGQCEDFFSVLGIEHCNQGRGDCRPKIYNLSACITTGNVHTTETTSTTSTLDDSNTDQQSTTVTALAITIVILIILLVIVSVALIWTCWTYKINGAAKNQHQQYRISDTLNATNTNQTSRQVHNPVYGHGAGDTRPAKPSQPPAWGGKKTEHAYDSEVIPPSISTSDKHNSKQSGSTAGQAKTHNTGGAARGTPKVSIGEYNEGQQVGAASKKDEGSERHPLDKGREGEGCNKELDYSHTRHFPNTNVTMKPENQYSKTAHLQNSNITKKPENHYSQTRQTPKQSSAANKPESPQYSTVGKSNATKKPDGGVNDRVYHTLDMSGENSDAHKDQQDGENVGNINDTRERENEYSAPNRQGGSDGHISKGAQEGGHEYHVLEGPEHDYHILEGLGDSHDTNEGIQERDHEYHILEGMTPELEGSEEGEEERG